MLLNISYLLKVLGGEGGIRTHGTLARTTVSSSAVVILAPTSDVARCPPVHHFAGTVPFLLTESGPVQASSFAKRFAENRRRGLTAVVTLISIASAAAR